MGVFDDKKFEELDWISQATEPIDSKLNEALAAIPETIEIHFYLYKALCTSLWTQDINVDSVLYHACRNYVKHPVSWEDRRHLASCFKLEVEGDDLTLNFSTQEIIGGSIRMVKVQTTMDEKILQSILGQEGLQHLRAMYTLKNEAITRANEIMELLTKCEEGIKSRSERTKRLAINRRMQDLFKENEWNIRDTELANRIPVWVRSYIEDGNLAAYSNFCRLKVMTHKGLPIYSMEEVK